MYKRQGLEFSQNLYWATKTIRTILARNYFSFSFTTVYRLLSITFYTVPEVKVGKEVAHELVHYVTWIVGSFRSSSYAENYWRPCIGGLPLDSVIGNALITWSDKLGTRPMANDGSSRKGEGSPVSKRQVQPRCRDWGGWCGAGQSNLTREIKLSDTNGDRENYIFRVQLITSMISNHTRLTSSLLKVTITQCHKQLSVLLKTILRSRNFGTAMYIIFASTLARVGPIHD